MGGRYGWVRRVAGATALTATVIDGTPTDPTSDAAAVAGVVAGSPAEAAGLAAGATITADGGDAVTSAPT
ncbi:MAG: hypothetical protein AVDCRST_MAG48-1029 [uncultured Friedmanniella sp.]|uniref:PDZ domain-containing protein n=1 Tax=uncultured Friedmanniella sp. TaxID=335381 RepID=A0A6J4K6V2_9ACTN|nr:MAG: hypothetical protein AVDCRST_MAG48-1029 [uncultured Friedmanniella sp.]